VRRSGDDPLQGGLQAEVAVELDAVAELHHSFIGAARELVAEAAAADAQDGYIERASGQGALHHQAAAHKAGGDHLGAIRCIGGAEPETIAQPQRQTRGHGEAAVDAVAVCAGEEVTEAEQAIGQLVLHAQRVGADAAPRAPAHNPLRRAAGRQGLGAHRPGLEIELQKLSHAGVGPDAAIGEAQPAGDGLGAAQIEEAIAQAQFRGGLGRHHTTQGGVGVDRQPLHRDVEGVVEGRVHVVADHRHFHEIGVDRQDPPLHAQPAVAALPLDRQLREIEAGRIGHLL